MPPTRLSLRRRSSLALNAFTPAKAGVYGIPKPVQFAPNVTPVSFTNPDNEDFDLDMTLSAAALFPPSETSSASGPVRRRGRRRSSGHIPRPPNAFMLFRKDFVRQKHVPGSIEANHGSLSKIIGNCWRQLPLEEKRVWEHRARLEKAEHQKAYPNYKFKPIHNKAKKDERKKKAKTLVPPEEEARCEEVAQLLLEGKKGEELAEAVRALDLKHRPINMPVHNLRQMHGQRRSSSVPPPITVPSLPFFGLNDMSRVTNDNPGSYIRRASSVQPEMFYHAQMQFPFDMPAFPSLETEPVLGDIQTSFNNPFTFASAPDANVFNNISLAPHELPFQWPSSEPSSAMSGSPASTVSTSLPVFAPQPMHAPAPVMPQHEEALYPDWSVSVMDAGQGEIDVSLFNQGMLEGHVMPAMGCAPMFDTSLLSNDAVYTTFNDFSLDQPVNPGFM